jgi:hypothetical protein
MPSNTPHCAHIFATPWAVVGNRKITKSSNHPLKNVKSGKSIKRQFEPDRKDWGLRQHFSSPSCIKRRYNTNPPVTKGVKAQEHIFLQPREPVVISGP